MAATANALVRKTVLVVEDDRATSDLLRAVVEEEGLRCVPASGGYAAIEMACTERPSLITLDLDLPDTDGHAVLHRLLADDRTRDIPIIIVSGFSGYLPDADGQKVAGVVTKPVEIDELADLVRSCVGLDPVR